MIRIDAIWLATEPLNLRAGPDTALALVVQVFREARALCVTVRQQAGKSDEGPHP